MGGAPRREGHRVLQQLHYRENKVSVSCVWMSVPPPHIANPNALFFATLSSHSWVHPKDIREPVHDPSLPAGWEVGVGLPVSNGET